MSGRPLLLDSYCGAGGAGMGYARAGFEVVGVDIAPQKHYPFEFHQGDALEFIARHGREFDAIHASPPCQRYSRLAFAPRRDALRHPDLVAATRGALRAAGRPYAIENVPGAPLHAPFMLCGTMFGLRVYRHRLFECSWFTLTPPHPRHRERVKARCRGHRLAVYTREPGAMVTVAGHMFGLAAGSAAMGIHWMTLEELAQAIPPAYCEWLGRQLLRAMGRGAETARDGRRGAR